MKIPFFFLLIGLIYFEPSEAQSYHISGNTLITSSKVQIMIGGLLKYSKPANNNSNFSSIFSEISLRSSTEDNLPKGISGNQSGKEVKVRKFYERKTDLGNKVYIIVGGGVINQAIDIERALENGEVLVERPSNGNLVISNSQADNTKRGILSTPLRFPWSKKPIPIVQIDSAKLLVTKEKAQEKSRDSLTAIQKRDSVQKIIIVDKETKKIPIDNLKESELVVNPVQRQTSTQALETNSQTASKIVETANPAKIVEIAPSLTNSKLRQETSNSPVSENLSGSTPILPSQAGSNSAHSVSSLLTLPAPVTSRADPSNVNTTKENSGYDKYNKLKQLKDLLDQGIINKDEFEVEKKKILSAN